MFKTKTDTDTETSLYQPTMQHSICLFFDILDEEYFHNPFQTLIKVIIADNS